MQSQSSTRPTTTLTTSMNFKQESGTYFQLPLIRTGKPDLQSFELVLDWNGCHSRVHSDATPATVSLERR